MLKFVDTVEEKDMDNLNTTQGVPNLKLVHSAFTPMSTGFSMSCTQCEEQ